MSEQHTKREGEALVVSTRKQVVTSKYRLDPHGRHMGFGLEVDTPTIVPAEVAADVSAGNRFGGTVRVVKGTQGALPTVIKPEDQAGRDRFLGRERKLSRKEQIDQLVRNEKIGPANLADSVLTLIEAGVLNREDAIQWGKDQRRIAVGSGTGNAEPWRQAARAIVEKVKSP